MGRQDTSIYPNAVVSSVMKSSFFVAKLSYFISKNFHQKEKISFGRSKSPIVFLLSIYDSISINIYKIVIFSEKKFSVGLPSGV
jgi:hypothetical protein